MAARRPEAKFMDRVDRDLESISAWVLNMDDLTRRGIPDRIICRNGFWSLEGKNSRSETRRQTGRIVLQRYELEQIEKAGGHGRIICPENWDEVLKEIAG